MLLEGVGREIIVNDIYVRVLGIGHEVGGWLEPHFTEFSGGIGK